MGNPGEQSFNLIVGWFIDFASPSQAIDPLFQASLLNTSSDITGDFLFAEHQNFGQGASAYWIQDGADQADQPMSLTNLSRFEQSYFADRSFLLTQVIATNDPRINLFSNAGTTDLNFTQEVLPTRTVVENPDVIVVATPTFVVPDTPGIAPEPPQLFVNFIQPPESRPVPTEQLPESYFLIRYTADDDGIFEFSFKWDDQNDDPDAIRSAIENAVLFDAKGYWNFEDDFSSSDWSKKIKESDTVRPGLYYIFEVQEGNELSEPVDAPIDRTDLENLVAPPSFEEGKDESQSITQDSEQVENPEFASDELDRNITTHSNLSKTTKNALLGSSLLMFQRRASRKESDSVQISEEVVDVSESRLFSMSKRWNRRNLKPR